MERNRVFWRFAVSVSRLVKFHCCDVAEGVRIKNRYTLISTPLGNDVVLIICKAIHLVGLFQELIPCCFLARCPC